MAMFGYICNVLRAQAREDGQVHILLQSADPQGTFREYYIAEDVSKREMLAIAMTAMVSKRQVQAWLENTAAYSPLFRIALT